MRKLIRKYGHRFNVLDVCSVKAEHQQAISIIRKYLTTHHEVKVEILDYDIVITEPVDKKVESGRYGIGQTRDKKEDSGCQTREIFAEVVYRPSGYSSPKERTGKGFGWPNALVRIVLSGKKNDPHWIVEEIFDEIEFEKRKFKFKFTRSFMDKSSTLMFMRD